jgi:hypothetical protein
MWKKYFKVVKIVPGIVIVHGYGKLDFSSDNISPQVCFELFEKDFIYLEITPAGRDHFYGTPVQTKTTRVKKKTTPKQVS